MAGECVTLFFVAQTRTLNSLHRVFLPDVALQKQFCGTERCAGSFWWPCSMYVAISHYLAIISLWKEPGVKQLEKVQEPALPPCRMGTIFSSVSACVLLRVPAMVRSS